MFREPWQSLDRKINKLETELGSATGWVNPYNKSTWDNIFNLCKEIQGDFKGVRYPTKQERDTAWQRFFDLRNSAYQQSNKIRESSSKEVRNEIFSRLNSLEYDWLGDFLVGRLLSFGLLAIRKEEMIYAGKNLREAGQYFSSVKHKMIREHKSEVFQRILSIRETHDTFWSRYKEISQQEYSKRREQNQRAWEEKQQTWKEKQENSQRIKANIENNLERNKQGLSKAIDALERHQDRRRKLQNDIYDAYNDNWKSKAEGWLDELNNKISDIESSIDRYRSWVSEDQDKLNSWN